MAAIRREDAAVKIPALIHLSCLGYRYLPRAGVPRDPETNILPGELRSALEAVNGFPLSEEALSRLLEEIRISLGRDDLGKSFFLGLRNGWGSLRLIDFDHPGNNRFRVMTEVPYISGPNRFRPDITLFVNGLPLAFVEVKSRSPKDGVRSEYQRMLQRIRNPSLRPFINETQIMVFSNDAEYDENDLIPVKGAFYATSAYDDLIFNHFEEEERDILQSPSPPDPLEAALILQDNHLEIPADAPLYQASQSASSPTHRLLTSLFHPRRLLFFLRYGISYLESREEDGSLRVSRQIIRYPQLFAVRFLEHQLRCGRPGGVWRIGSGARPALASAQIRFMSDYYAAEGRQVHFYYFAEDPAQARAVGAAFRARGFRVIRVASESALLRARLWEEARDSSPAPLVSVVALSEDQPLPLPAPSAGKGGLRVCFFDGISGGYSAGPPFPALLRSADPEAVVLEYRAESVPAEAAGP